MAGQGEPSTLQAAGQFLSDTAGQMQSAVKGAADNVKAAVRTHLGPLTQRMCQLPCSRTQRELVDATPLTSSAKIIGMCAACVCAARVSWSCTSLLPRHGLHDQTWGSLPGRQSVGGIRFHADMYGVGQSHLSSHRKASGRGPIICPQALLCNIPGCIQ